MALKIFSYSPPLAAGDIEVTSHFRFSSVVGQWWKSANLFVTCIAISMIAAFLAIAFVKPHWNAAGMLSFYKYGKNTEHAAVFFALVGVTAFSLLHKNRMRGSVLVAVIGAVLIGVSAYLRDFSTLPSVTQTLIGMALYFVWFDRYRTVRTPNRSYPLTRWAIAVSLLFLLSAYVFVLFSNPASKIDLHHQGEIVTSALDLVHGGVPYRTYFLPHGLSDTGVAAVIARQTGNWGMGMLVILNSATAVIGIISIFLLCVALMRDPVHALALTLAIGFLAVGVLAFFANAIFAIAALLLIANSRHPLAILSAGASVGLGYLWRIETGVYALVALVAFMLIDTYYTEGYRLDGRWYHLLSVRKALSAGGKIGLLVIGIALALYTFYSFTGFPTIEWYKTTLIDLPRYHRDSTGQPLPLPWGRARFLQGGGTAAVVTVPAVFSLLFGLLAYTLVRAKKRAFPASDPYDRAYLAFLLFGLVNFKTVLDRSAPGHIASGTAVFSIFLLVDMISHVYHGLPERKRIVYTLAAGFAGLLFVTTGICSSGLSSWGLISSRNFDVIKTAVQPVRTAEDAFALSAQQPAAILDGVHEIRNLLDKQGIGRRELLVHHSAAYIYPLLGQDLPTKYYCLGWAVTPEMQRELIQELQESKVRAYLQVNGISGSLVVYDIADRYRIPIVADYLLKERQRGKHYKTKLGDLVIVPDNDKSASSKPAELFNSQVRY